MTHTLSLILTYDFSEGGQLKGDNITIKNVLLLFLYHYTPHSNRSQNV